MSETKILTAAELLKLARDITTGKLADKLPDSVVIPALDYLSTANKVAKALIERLEPVKIPRDNGVFSSPCPCGKRYPGGNDNFCPNCGKEIQWT